MIRSRRAFVLVCVFVFICCFIIASSNKSKAFNGLLLNRSDRLSDSQASTSATNLVSFQITDLVDNLGSVQLSFCSNSPIISVSCTPPSGFNASGAVLSAQSGNTGFSISGASTSNVVILTRAPAPPNPDLGNPSVSTTTFQLDSVVNPNFSNEYYLKLQIFPTTDASGPDTQEGGVALATNNPLGVNAQVPRMLFFCTAISFPGNDCALGQGDSINFGNFSNNITSSGTSQFIVSGNPDNGFTVSVQGTTMTSGNDTISALASPTPSVTGVNQFGLNLRANSTPSVGNNSTGSGIAVPTSNYNQTNRFTFNPNDVVVASASRSDYQTFTVSYIVNTANGQAPGVYVTTLTYVCLANF